MNKDLIIFGKTSILATNFDSHINKSKNNIIYITRKQKSLNDVVCNIGNNLKKEELDEISLKISKLSNNPQKVFILFSWSGGPRKYEKNNTIINSNILKNFLELSKLVKAKKLIFISSAGAVYPESKSYKFRESDETLAQNIYGLQKLKSEKSIKEFSESENIKYTILRVSSAFGFDPRFSDQGVINKWLHHAINKNILQLYNSPDSLINFISFDNISVALGKTIDLDLEGIFNIGSENSISLQEIINVIGKITNRKIDYEIHSENRRFFKIDINKFYNQTGIIFKINLLKDISNLYQSIIKIKHI